MQVSEAMEWRKYRLLGTGSYGSVYLAGLVNNSYWMDSIVAVKSGDTQHSISSLEVEASLLQELRGCPYIIQGLGNDVSLEQGRMVHNLVLEYACFGSLDKIIKNFPGHMSESLLAIYTYMLVKGLATIHEKEIVHCDFKPANILVFPLPESSGIDLLKIADFGLSKKIWEGDCKRRCTPLYASPETLTCGLQEKAGDIWALGCTVVEMITGQPLWSCSSSNLYHQIAYGSPKIPENISEDAKDFLGRCLNKDHNQRWTAEMLLHHPFIVNNLKSSRFGIYLRNQEQVLPTKRWVCSKDMFSTTSKAQSDNVYKTYKLFANDKKQGCENPFPLPCGAELIAALSSRFQAVGGYR